MKRHTWLALAVLAALAGALILQGRSLAKLQNEHTSLRTAQAEVHQLAEANRELAASRAAAEQLQTLRAATRDLLRLRNEVRQLREQQPELEKLRGENQRLADQVKSAAVPAKSITQMEGFVAKESWSQAGFGSPEAAVQTLFWALQNKNLQNIADCMEPTERDQFLKQFEQMSDEQRRRTTEEFTLLAKLKGFRVAEKTVEAEDKVVLSLQVAAGGELLKIPLRRVGTEWKIEKF